MCISDLNLFDGDADPALGIGIDIDAHYESFRLYSAYGGQEGIPRIVFSAVESKPVYCRRPVVRIRASTPQLSARA